MASQNLLRCRFTRFNLPSGNSTPPSATKRMDHPLQDYVHSHHRLAARQAPSLQLPN
jgi:hypothetical protein